MQSVNLQKNYKLKSQAVFKIAKFNTLLNEVCIRVLLSDTLWSIQSYRCLKAAGFSILARR